MNANKTFLRSCAIPLVVAAAFLMQSRPLMAQAPTPDVLHDLAPTGAIRVAINYGNGVLAQKDPATGEPRGVSAALARALALRLRVPVHYVLYDTARLVFEALEHDAWDLTFLAIDPARSEGIDFTPPYVIIEGGYLVARDSSLRAVTEADRPGIRVAAGKGSAYDLYLARTLKQATLVQAPTSLAALRLFRDEHLDVAAGVRASLVAYAAEHPDVRVLPGRFMAIEQAMGTPKGRTAGLNYLRVFLEGMKASGFVGRALAESGQADAVVAPPAAVK